MSLPEHGIRVNENGVMLRPNRSDEVVRRRAAEMALPEINRWLGSTDIDEELIAQLMKHIDGINGYEIAKSLEHDGWPSDSGLVQILAGGFIYLAEDELVKQWVKCLNIKLEIPIGTPVMIKHSKEVGVVTKHYPESAKYGVRTQEQPETSCWAVLPEEIEIRR